MYIFFGAKGEMYYLIGVAALLLIISIVFFIQSSKKAKLTIDQAIEKYNEQIKKNIQETQNNLDQVEANLRAVKADYKEAERMRLIEQERAKEARDATDRLLKTEHERAAAELGRVKEVEEEHLKHEFELKRINLEKQFTDYKTQLENNFSSLSEHYTKELANITLELEEYQAKRAAINDAILRERELEEKEDFYRISIKENDIKDIEVLRSIEPRLTNREVLNKLIYEVFIKRPLMEMEKRVLKGQKIGGIYKITYIKTGEAYIGRSVDIGNRWKEHCLSSLNIGTIAHSTFHNILAEKGLQNFTWEVLEEVDKDKQSSREKYWVDFYQTNKQYNSKAGG